MKYITFTDQGLRRRNNEDSLLALPEKGLYAVADGLGGHSAGEVASRKALEIIAGYSYSENGPARDDIIAAISGANKEVWEQGQSDPGLRGMGTTVSMLLLKNGEVEIGHVGDSRIYLYHQGELNRLTRDHTLAQEWLDTGKISGELEPEHSANHIVTRALGAKDDVDVEYSRYPVEEKDILLLCTDGVNKHITDPELAKMIDSSAGDIDILNKKIARRVIEDGATDNFTYILIIV
jgi:protein phosphatase